MRLLIVELSAEQTRGSVPAFVSQALLVHSQNSSFPLSVAAFLVQARVGACDRDRVAC